MGNDAAAVKVINGLLDEIGKSPCADTVLDSAAAGAAFEFLAATRDALSAMPDRQAERDAIVAWFRKAAEGVRIDAQNGLWDGIEDQVQDAIEQFNGYATAIENGEHLK